MRCPLHEDHKRSASLNVNTWLWYCNAGCGGGKVSTLLARMVEEGIETTASTQPLTSLAVRHSSKVDLSHKEIVRQWHRDLLADEVLSNQLMSRRGLNPGTIRDHLIGY